MAITLDSENLKHKREESSPQCFSGARGFNKATPSKASNSRLLVYPMSKLAAISFSVPDCKQTCLKNMVLILIKIQSWLQKPKVWTFVCFFSSVVGLLCYAFSSSFNHLFGKWTWWKILLYIVFSFIIFLAVLFAKTWERSSSPRLEARMAFFILMITSVYSFFFDKEVEGKPDAYTLFSCAAFAIMSLGLARQSHLGFEIDLLYFFCGVLTVQLMKINLWLVSVGGSFSYSLIILRSSLDGLQRSEYHGFQDQDHVVIEFGLHSQSQGTASSPSATQADSPKAAIVVASEANSLLENEDLGFLVTQPQQGNRDGKSEGILTRFMGCIEALKKENRNVIDAIFKHVDEYLNANLVDKEQIPVPQLQHDDNLVVDSMPSGIINELGESARLMITAGLTEECLQVYTTCRREFVNEILSAFALIELKTEDIDKVMKTQYSIKALCVADGILLPNERRLFERVFDGSIFLEDKYPALPGMHELGFQEYLDINPGRIDAYRFSKCLGIYPTSAERTGIDALSEKSLGIYLASAERTETDAFRFEKSLRILGDLLYLTDGVKDQATVPDGILHHITLYVLNYGYMIYQDWVGLFRTDTMVNKEGKFSLYGHMAMITDLLDSSLEAIFKSYNNPTLGYVFIINNRMFIKQREKRRYMKTTFGNDWLRMNTAKFQQYLELYLKSTWKKIVDLLKLDINESDPNVAVELMKDKLRSFNEHLDDICNVQSMWFVSNEELRDQIIKSIENILLPAYGNFIARMQDFLGKQTYEHIKYGMFDVQNRLNNSLFLVRE